MKLLKTTFCAIFLATVSMLSGALAQPIDTADILKKVDAIRSPAASFTFTVKLHAQTAVSQNESEFEVLVRDSSKSLVLYRQPIKQRGRALLLDGINMWIYIPGAQRPVRISPQQQLTGAVANADVARVVFNLDYTVDSTEKQHLDTLPVLKLKLRARHKNVLYQQVELWVLENNLQPLKADFFSLSDKLVRSIQYGGYQNILGRARPTVLHITDAINPTIKATLTYSDFKLQETPQEYYQPSYLRSLAN